MKRCWFKMTNFSLLMFSALTLSIAAFGVTPVSAFSVADLSITKTDGVTTAVPGGSVTYTITASNAGPDFANGATVADTFPAILTGTWTCVGAGGGTCTAAGSGNINDTVNLPAGGSVTYTVSATINASATGTLSNTATVTSGAASDPNPANNSATDTDTLTAQADLAITKTDGVATATPGGSVTYTITASNVGPSNASGATVADTFPAVLTGTWICVGAGGGTCTAAGSGNINDTVNLPAGGSVTYTVSATVSASATGTLSNTATVNSPAGVTDPTPGNNSATDTDTVACSAAITVTNASDSGAGSLRQAIADVCDGGTITFDASLDGQTITLTGQLTIGKNLTIDGGANNITVSGNNAVRVFYVNSGVTFNLQNLTVAGGGGGVYCGGGINNSGGSVNVTGVTFSGNSADVGGGIFNNPGMGMASTVTDCTFSGNSGVFGGGLYNFGTLTVTNNTFSGNSAGNGGGMYINGTVTLTNNTFSGNSAGNGGGIYNSGTLTVTGSTISSNSASMGGGGIFNGGTGMVTITNSIIAASLLGGNCENSGIISGTSNLADDGSCGSSFTNSSSILLGPLGDYGGPTQTMPLLPGSAAIDAGDVGYSSASDQRGKDRVAACDIGAFESQGFTLTVSGGNNQSAEVNTAFAAPLSLTVTADNASEPVDGGQIIFTAPASGASAAITGSPATIIGGSVSVTATANGTAGLYTLIVEATGANQLSFNLENSVLPVTTTTTTVPETTTTTIPVRDDCLTVVPAKVTKLLWGDSVAEKELQAKNGDKQLDPEAIIALIRIAGYAIPLQSFIMIGDSDTVFTWKDRPEWNTDEIHTLLKLKLRKKIMFALVFINPFTAEAGTYEVTIGDCAGTMELLEP